MYLKLSCKILALSLFIVLCFSFDTLAQENFSPFQGEINSHDINIRSDSTVSAPIICSANKGSLVEVISEFYEWYKIRLPKFSPSYIKKSLVECIGYKEPQKLNDCQNGKILKNRANVRLSPDETSPVLGQIDKDEIINIIQEKADWYKIEPIQNSFGWIHKKFVNPVTNLVSNGVNKTGGEISLPQDNEDNITVKGLIMPYGKFIKRIATHKLLTPDNEIFLLKGSKGSLDALNYHKVKVIGKKVNLPKQKYPLIEVKILEAIN